MDEAWQILRDGGLPLALPRSDARPSANELAVAVRTVLAAGPRGREADALAAFVLAWHQHWPRAFASAHGERGAEVVAWARRTATDLDRYLKLRRISLENLAQVL